MCHFMSSLGTWDAVILVLITLKTHVFQRKMQKETDTEKYIYQPFWGCLCDSSKKYYLELT